MLWFSHCHFFTPGVERLSRKFLTCASETYSSLTDLTYWKKKKKKKKKNIMEQHLCASKSILLTFIECGNGKAISIIWRALPFNKMSCFSRPASNIGACDFMSRHFTKKFAKISKFIESKKKIGHSHARVPPISHTNFQLHPPSQFRVHSALTNK